jgi:hypothetical protein
MIGVINRKDFKHTMTAATPRISGGAVPQADTIGFLSFFFNYNLFHYIAGANGINHVQTFRYLAKYGVVPVEVRRCCPGVTYEELRASGIASGVSHREHSAIVKLVLPGQFAVDVVARSAAAGTFRASALDHEVGDYPVKYQAVIETLLREGDEVLHGVGRIFLKELDLHDAFFGMDLSCFHNGFFQDVCLIFGRKLHELCNFAHRKGVRLERSPKTAS